MRHHNIRMVAVVVQFVISTIYDPKDRRAKTTIMCYLFDESKKISLQGGIFSIDDRAKKSLAELIKVTIKYIDTATSEGKMGKCLAVVNKFVLLFI